jgi:HK97 gp10 family phage protein
MAARNARVDGLTEARAALEALPEAFRKAAAKTIAEGAALIEREARMRVVRMARTGTGELARSIGTNVRGDGLQAAVGTGLNYGRYFEVGTKRQQAKPFLYPAFKKGARHVRKEMRGWAEEAGRRVKFKTKRAKPRAA